MEAFFGIGDPSHEIQLYRTSDTFVKKFPIVGVGASAGGLEAFAQLLEELPLDTGMAFILVQHLAPTHESALPELLAKATSGRIRLFQCAGPHDAVKNNCLNHLNSHENINFCHRFL